MKLKDISRTATFAWDQSSSASPLIATGAVAGALDESFSNESQLEIWAPDFGDGSSPRLGGDRGAGAKGTITVGSRFNRIAWSCPTATNGRGVIAAGMETGEINVFDPEKILAGSTADDARLFKNDKHTGPVKGLDFNPIQKNLMVSGAIKAELYIFDLNKPATPIPPGPPSTKLGEITSLQWNPTVPRIFAASSSSGYTSVWDLKVQKEIASLQYGGGAAKGMDNVGGQMGLQMGKRRGMSDVCWHPEQAMRLVTASEDDESPIIMLWDLRNTRAPERILSGHTKGVLSLSWCHQDPDLLLSCGKDNRTICWNPRTGDIVGEMPTSNDWAFQTAWCPRNPDLLATASFDGHIGIHSLQTTHEPEQPERKFTEDATADDIFGALGQDDDVEYSANVMSLSQPPNWLKRPVSASFGFGGLLASTCNLTAANGKHQSSVVHLRKVITESSIIERAKALEATGGDKEKLDELCGQRAQEEADAAWKSLKTLFTAKSKEDLVQLMGFSREDVAKQVEEAINKLPTGTVKEATGKRDAAVSFLEPEEQEQEDGSGAETPTSTKPGGTPSEISVTSESTKRTELTELMELGLLDDDVTVPGTRGASGADFFSSMAAGTLRNPHLSSVVPHKQGIAESSAAATVGSRASSVRSEPIRNNTFHIYPSGVGETDRLITQALVVGDFASAVNLCLASERFADALLLAVRGGPDLLQSTQKAYFARQTASRPFLRVYQSIVTEDLADIVQNTDLDEWKAAFAVVCTFAREGDFNNLADQLGQRLQFNWQVLAGSEDTPEGASSAKAARENATLCFLAARRLEKVVGIWINEMMEEEATMDGTKYTAHAQALQSFIEKVAVFIAATGYVDDDLLNPTESVAAAEAGVRTYRLASLYDRFYEYADLLATQGMVDMAAKYVQMTPPDYKGTGAAGSELDKARDRLLQAAGLADGGSKGTSALSAVQPTRRSAVPPSAGYDATPTPYAAQTKNYAQPPSAYGTTPTRPTQPPAPSYGFGDSNPYAPAAGSQPYDTNPPYGNSNGYGPSDPQAQGYGVSNMQSQYGAPPAPVQPPLGPPPRAGQNASLAPPPSTSTPPAARRDQGGWNDAPNFSAPKRPASAAKEVRPAAIMSPFPMSSEPQMGPGPPQGFAQGGMQSPPQGPPQGLAPPPRGQPGMLPPPPKGGPRPPSAQAVARGQFGSTPQMTPQPMSPPRQQQPPPPQGPPRGSPMGRGGPPPGAVAGPPPPRALSPLNPAGRMASPLGGGGAAGVGGMRSLQQGLQQMSPPSGVAGPPPGARAGPPPPGRRASSQVGDASGTPPASLSTPPPQSPVAPTKPQHPSGDRSHIPPKSRPIFEILSAEMTRVKQSNLPAHLKRIVDDTDRRLNILFDGLNDESVPDHAVDQMLEISKAVAQRDANAALAMHVDLLTNSTGDMGQWTPGVKQLIRLGLP